MNFLKVTILALALCCFVSANHIRRQHKFLGLDSLNPMQTIQLMSGDWTAILPQSIRGVARQLLGKQDQTGPSALLGQAQSLLGGGNGGNPLSGLLGGLTGGSGSNSSSGGMGSMLGGLSGLSSIFGGNAPPANTGLSGMLGGLTGGSGNSSSGIGSALSGLTNAVSGGSGTSGTNGGSSGFGLNSITGLFSHKEQVHKKNKV